VVIATKFGWNIDPDTGKHHGGQQPAGPYKAGGRRLAQASADRGGRSALSASGGSECTD
jgi:hypothetical protein